MLRMVRVNVKSFLGGKRKRMNVVIGLTEEEQKDKHLNDILMFKVCEKLTDEFGGKIPKEFGFNLELVSMKDL